LAFSTPNRIAAPLYAYGRGPLVVPWLALLTISVNGRAFHKRLIARAASSALALLCPTDKGATEKA
jgi:hypothetical protein